MTKLVAFDLAPGPGLERAIRSAWDAHEAVTVLDPRWSPTQRSAMLEVLDPHVVVSEQGRSIRSEALDLDESDGAVVLTSGSSGRPKAAVLTRDALAASAVRTADALYRGRPSVFYHCLPSVHIGGLALIARAHFVTGDRAVRLLWGPASDIELGPSRGATHCAVVATTLTRHSLDQYDLVLLGGGRAPQERASNVVTTYGLTETGSGVVYDGRALDGVDIAIVEGEIWVNSPTLLRAYRDGTDPRRVGPDGQPGWFPTGDGGGLSDGVLRVDGRLDNVINTGGEKVWPDDVEALLSTVPGVADVAVVGREDPEWGQRVVALVVSQEASEALWREARAVVREHLGPWSVPKEFEVVPDIARTANGKIRRDLLR